MIARKEYQFSALMDGFFDGPHATPDPSDVGAVFLGIKNIREEGGIDLSDIRYISEEEYPRWTKRVIPEEGDIVFSYEATLHRYALIPSGFRGCLGRRMALIRVNKEILDSSYLYYYFLSPYWRAFVETVKVAGATVDRISIIDFPKYKVCIPPLSTQKKIAKILSAYDDLIENNNKRINLLEEMAEEIYKEWFVRMRFPGYKNCKFFDKDGKEVPFETPGVLPEGWKREKLDTLLFFDKGVEPGSENYVDNKIDESFVPFLRVGDLGSRNGGIFVKKDLVKGKIVVKSDILITLDGTVGKVAMGMEGCYSSGIRRIVFKTEKIKRAFCYFTLLSSNIQGTIQAHAVGTTILHASSAIKFMRISLPCQQILKNFEKIVNPMLEEVLVLGSKNKVLKETRDLLLPRLISGKLSVEDIEEAESINIAAESVLNYNK